MKYLFYKTGLVLLLVVLVQTSCDKYLDVNTDPNRVTAVSLSSLLPTAIEGLSTAHYQIAFTSGQASHQIDSYFGYYEEFTMTSAWTTLYLRCMNNLTQLIDQAEESNAPHYVGVGKVLMAASLGLATDTWESAPYSEALQGSENLTPAYDSQEALYTQIDRLLSDAINSLQAPSSVFSPGDDDLIYDGDLDSWLKAANALKARYNLHLMKKGGNYASNALTAAGAGFSSNADDMQLTYNPVNKNPWHITPALANNTGNLSITHAGFFIDLLRDNNDPRLPVLADKGGNTEYYGLTSYDPDDDASTVDFTEDTWHSRESAPVLMCTYAELKFIEAEAALPTDAPRAYSAYLAGINASMEKFGIDAMAATDYLMSGAVAADANSLTLGHIMREKYIALFLNPEVWVDMRRQGYSTGIYTGLFIPDQNNGPAQRAQYPQSEFNRNGTEVNKVKKGFTETMWRDQ
ncbi:MAG: SusD/RagB family nutrient-binding outer membrane lipoprotein [Bacteroidetes bacterium]|nr:MAG: SusD/RagB family nutrient-binding outer membrane lipoprotein [Bacteroidota bacterium]